MPLIHVNFQDNGDARVAPWDKNTLFNSAGLTYPVTLLDADGLDSGLRFTDLSSPLSLSSPTTAPSPSITGWPDDVSRRFWYGSFGGSLSHEMSGLEAGQEFNLYTIGWSNVTGRNTGYQVNSLPYQIYVVDTADPQPQLSFNGTADADGKINITLNSETFRPYVCGYIIEPLAAPDTVTPTETDYSYGETITLSTSLAGSITATLTDSASNVLSLTKISDTQFTIPSLAGGQSTVLSETGVQLEVSNGANTAIVAIEITPPAGYAATVLTSIVDRALIETDWIFGFDTPAVIGDQSFENSSIVTHNVDGTSTFTSDGTYTYFTIQASSGLVSEITKTVGVESEGIPSINRTTWNAVGAYLRTQGYTGGNNDVIMEWLSDQGFEGAYNDRWDGYWDSLGYTGGHNDKRTQWVKS